MENREAPSEASFAHANLVAAPVLVITPELESIRQGMKLLTRLTQGEPRAEVGVIVKDVTDEYSASRVFMAFLNQAGIQEGENVRLLGCFIREENSLPGMFRRENLLDLNWKTFLLVR
ncbi:hypothetical protein WDW86_17115 [Bdellovibrionota bacterium FG-2]